MKKIKVHAYTQLNVGDDLFIKVLCDRYPDTLFILSAPKQYKKSFKDIGNLRINPNDSLFSRGMNYLGRKLNLYHFTQLRTRHYDATILIGGSLFIQDRHWRKKFNHMKDLKMRGKPFFLLGANFGPFHDRTFYLKHKSLFKRYTDICFRDQYSYDLFKDLPHVRMASDMIFQLPVSKVKHDEKSIAISIIKPSIRKDLIAKDAIYYQKIREIIIYFIENGYTVTLMAFCEFEGDQEAVDTVMESLPTNYLAQSKKYYYQGDLVETLNMISRASFVVATRFHAMILGWLYGKPVFPIAYSPKMKHVMNDIGFKGTYADFDKLDNLKAADVFSSMNTNYIDVTAQIKSSHQHFNKLDTYLLGEEKVR